MSDRPAEYWKSDCCNAGLASGSELTFDYGDMRKLQSGYPLDATRPSGICGRCNRSTYFNLQIRKGAKA